MSQSQYIALRVAASYQGYGRKLSLEREAWGERYGIATLKKRLQIFTPEFMNQLCHCKSDSARRLLIKGDGR